MNPTRSFPIVLAATALVVGSACGSTSTNSAGGTTPESPAPVGTAVAAPPAPTDSPPATTAPATTTPLAAPATPAPTTTAPPVVTVATPTTIEAQPTPDSVPATDADAPCGEFGPIPPRPDSMPTRLFDTDADGVMDDEATAYGGEGGWRIRIVENGITSEAVMPDIKGWARLDLPVLAPNGEWITVIDAETDEEYVFTTDADGCVALISGATGDEIEALTTGDQPCGSIGSIQPSAVIATDISVDIVGDGSPDDRLVSYVDADLDGEWRLRAEVNGLVSEVSIAGVGPHSVGVIGLADVGKISAGPEILATTGGDASGVEIGVFGFAGAGCITPHMWQDGTPLSPMVGATIGSGNSTYCGDGYLGLNGYQQDADGTYSAWGAAYEEVDVASWAYIGASDDYSEGMAYDDLTPATFDCFDLTL